MSDINYKEFSDIISLIESIHVPECSNAFDGPLSESNFIVYRETIEHKIEQINNYLKKELTDTPQNIKILAHEIETKWKSSLIHLIILCGEHSINDYWNTKLCVNIASEILKNMLCLLSYNSLEELLIVNKQMVFKNTLIVLRPKLLVSTWKSNPAAIQCYYWLLMKVKAPYLNDYLNDVLPTALILNDDFEVLHRMKGLKCITHIVDNVTKADLEMYGQDDVILVGLRPTLYVTDSELLDPLLTCYVTLMKKLEPRVQVNSLKRNKFDDIFDTILNNLNLEKIKSKIIYLKYLPQMISILQLRTVRHLQKLFDFIARELELEESDDHCKILLFQVLDTTVKTCWPRFNLSKQYRPVLMSILKFLHNYLNLPDNKDVPPYSDLIERIKTSFQLVNCLSETELKQIRCDINNGEQFDERYKALVNYVLT